MKVPNANKTKYFLLNAAPLGNFLLKSFLCIKLNWYRLRVERNLKNNYSTVISHKFEQQSLIVTLHNALSLVIYNLMFLLRMNTRGAMNLFHFQYRRMEFTPMFNPKTLHIRRCHAY